MRQLYEIALLVCSVALVLLSFDLVTVFTGLAALPAFLMELGSLFRLPDDSGGGFYEYQTTITGLIGATVAAIVAYQYYHMRNKKMLSARAKMNNALSDACAYARECFNAVLKEKEEAPESQKPFLETLEDAIEFLDKKTSESVYQLIIHYQVHNARLHGYIASKNDKQTIYGGKEEERLYDAVLLYCLASRLFSYARGSDEYNQPVRSIKHRKPDNKEMRSALNAVYGYNKTIMSFQDDQLKDLIKLIDYRHKN